MSRSGNTVAGTWGYELVPALEVPPPGALLVDKHRSAFWGTPLDTILRSNDIRTAIVVGCTTEGCVDSTVREAGFLDYFPVVVEGAVATNDPILGEAAMRIVRAYRADVITSAELERLWRPVRAAPRPLVGWQP